jgi:hypothetical protein
VTEYIEFKELEGKIFKDIEGAKKGSDTIIFISEGGNKYEMIHSQDCCEEVRVEEIVGDINKLIGEKILFSEKVTNKDPDNIYGYNYSKSNSSHTWTFFKMGTIKGDVTFRWLGESNGYYSEDVKIIKEV